MNIKKYDRLQSGQEIIEALGLQMNVADSHETRECFKVITPKEDAGRITTYYKELLEHLEFKKVEPTVHPLIEEIGDEAKANPEFINELFKSFIGFFNLQTDEERQAIYDLIKKYVPVKRLEEFLKLTCFPGRG